MKFRRIASVAVAAGAAVLAAACGSAPPPAPGGDGLTTVNVGVLLSVGLLTERFDAGRLMPS